MHFTLYLCIREPYGHQSEIQGGVPLMLLGQRSQGWAVSLASPSSVPSWSLDKFSFFIWHMGDFFISVSDWALWKAISTACEEDGKLGPGKNETYCCMRSIFRIQKPESAFESVVFICQHGAGRQRQNPALHSEERPQFNRKTWPSPRNMAVPLSQSWALGKADLVFSCLFISFKALQVTCLLRTLYLPRLEPIAVFGSHSPTGLQLGVTQHNFHSMPLLFSFIISSFFFI